MAGGSALSTQGLSAAKWGAAASMLKLVLIFVSQVYFARLLGPDIYGVFAAATIVTMLTAMVADLGMSWTMLQTQDLDRRDMRFAFTWVLVFSTVLGVILVALSWAISGWLGDTRSAPLLMTLTALTPFVAVTTMMQNLLLRAMRSRELALIQLLSYAVGFCGIGVLASLAGAGVWSMVIGVVTNLLVYFVMLLRAMPPRELRPLFFDRRGARLMRLSRWTLVTVLTNWLVNNVDRVIVSRYFGSTMMGHYTNAVNLANVPTGTIVNVVSPVFLTLGSQVASDSKRLAGAYLQVLTLVLVLLLPLFGVVAADATALVTMVYGHRWIETGPLLGVLMMTTPFMVALGVTTPILWNTGNPQLEAAIQWPLLLLAVGALMFAKDEGVVALAVTVLAFTILRSLLFQFIAARKLSIPLREMLAPLASGVVLAALAGGATAYAGAIWRGVSVLDWLGRNFAPPGTGSLLIENLICLSTGTLCLVLCLVACPRLIDTRAWALLAQALPSGLRPRLVRLARIHQT